GLILAELVSTVDSVQRRKRRRHKHPNHERRAATLLKHDRKDVGRIRPEVRPKIFAHLRLRKLREIVDELLFRVSPGEIVVALVKPRPGQSFHHLWPGERFGEKNRVRIFSTNAFDQILPERNRLGMRIVHAKDPNTALGPKQNDAFHLGPKLAPVFASKVYGI